MRPNPTSLKYQINKANDVWKSVWRPLNGPVQDWPLATMDFRTVDPAKEMFPCDLLKGENEERGQTATFTHSDGQKWYYLDKQTSSEVTVLKIWDSAKSVASCKMMPLFLFASRNFGFNGSPHTNRTVLVFSLCACGFPAPR